MDEHVSGTPAEGVPVLMNVELTIKEFLILHKALDVVNASQLNYCNQFMGATRIYIEVSERYQLVRKLEQILRDYEDGVAAIKAKQKGAQEVGV